MIRGVIEVIAPVKAQPVHCIENGIHIFRIFLSRVGVVKAHMAHAIKVARNAEVEANGFGMPNMQVAIGLGRKTRGHTVAVFGLCQIFSDNIADKVGGRNRGWIGHFGGHGAKVVCNLILYLKRLLCDRGCDREGSDP